MADQLQGLAFSLAGLILLPREPGWLGRRVSVSPDAPLAEDAPEDPVEAVSVFERGYYD